MQGEETCSAYQGTQVHTSQLSIEIAAFTTGMHPLTVVDLQETLVLISHFLGGVVAVSVAGVGVE